MKKYLIQFVSAARAGEDDTFNKWYDEVHVPDVLALPDFKSCQRYRMVEGPDVTPRYVAAYEVETPDPQATLARLFEASKSMLISPSLDPERVSITILEPR